MTVNLDSLIVKMTQNMGKVLEKYDIDMEKDDYTIIQPLNYGQCVTIKVGEDDFGVRGVTANVEDTTIIMEPIDDILDVFGGI